MVEANFILKGGNNMWTVVELGLNTEENKYYILGYNSELKLTHGFAVNPENNIYLDRFAPGIVYPTLLQARLTMRDTTPYKISINDERTRMEIEVFKETNKLYNDIITHDDHNTIEDKLYDIMTDKSFMSRYYCMVDRSTIGLDMIHYLDIDYLVSDHGLRWIDEGNYLTIDNFKFSPHSKGYEFFDNGKAMMYTNIMFIVMRKYLEAMKNK